MSTSVINDVNGQKIVVINDVRFKGKRKIDWNEVEEYLKKYIGKFYEITEYADKIYIGNDFPDEFSSSEYTRKLKGTLAKAKANMSQGIPELISIATNRSHNKDFNQKHKQSAVNGWYRYDIRFALPVFNEKEEIQSYNVFRARLLVRLASNGKMYLYDVVNIKKETSNPHM